MAEKIGGKRAPKKARGAGSGGDGRVLAPNDNLAAVREAERAQLISFISRLTAQKGETAKAKTLFDTEKDKETEIFRLANDAGFQRKELEELITDINCKGRSRDLVEAEERRRRFRDALGLPTGNQMELFTSEATPQEVKDEAHWRAEGYLAYQRNEECKPPKEVPQRFIQIWTKGWQDGQTATAMAMKFMETEPAPAPAPAAAAGDADEHDADDEGAAAEGDDDGFSASEDELAGQSARRAIQDARDGRTSGDDDGGAGEAAQPEAEGV